jgi:uncharacterized protein
VVGWLRCSDLLSGQGRLRDSGPRANSFPPRARLTNSPIRCRCRTATSSLRLRSSVFVEMTASRATYLDSSAIVKLAVAEPESPALRRYLRRRAPLVSSALARTEVSRALLPLGVAAVRRGHQVLARLELVRVSDRILEDAGSILPAEVRSLDAIHLATMQQMGGDLARVLTYDARQADAAVAVGLSVVAPA